MGLKWNLLSIRSVCKVLFNGSAVDWQQNRYYCHCWVSVATMEREKTILWRKEGTGQWTRVPALLMQSPTYLHSETGRAQSQAGSGYLLLRVPMASVHNIGHEMDPELMLLPLVLFLGTRHGE